MMTKEQLIEHLRGCADLADACGGDRHAVVSIDNLRLAIALLMLTPAEPASHYHQNCATCTCREPVEIRDPYRPKNTADV